MLQYRTDLAMEAHELLCARSRAQTLSGVDAGRFFARVQRDERGASTPRARARQPRQAPQGGV